MPLNPEMMADYGSNYPPLKERVEALEHQVEAMRSALAHVMTAMIPAFQALESLEAAAKIMRDTDEN